MHHHEFSTMVPVAHERCTKDVIVLVQGAMGAEIAGKLCAVASCHCSIIHLMDLPTNLAEIHKLLAGLTAR